MTKEQVERYFSGEYKVLNDTGPYWVVIYGRSLPTPLEVGVFNDTTERMAEQWRRWTPQWQETYLRVAQEEVLQI